MFRYNAAIVSILLSKKRMSCFVTYLYMKEKYSGKLFKSKISELAKLRGLSCSTIKEHIQQLLEFGFIEDRLQFGEKGEGWFFVIGNERYNLINNLIGRDCVVFDHKYDNRLAWLNNCTIQEKLESFKDLKKLRTYLHIALQQIATTKYLKPTLTHAQEAEKADLIAKKKEKRNEKQRLKYLKKKKGESILVDQPKESQSTSTSKKTETQTAFSLNYSVSSTYLTKALGTYQKGFSAPTIRRQQNKAVKLKFLEKTRCFNILASTEEFSEYHQENFYKHNLDFSDTVLTTQKGIAEIANIATKPNNLYSPLFLWTNRGDSNKGEIDALVQEVSPKIGFGCSIGKFRKNKRKLLYNQEFEKIVYSQSIRPKLTVEELMRISESKQ